MQTTFQQKLQAKLRAHQALNQMIVAPSKEDSRGSHVRELSRFHPLTEGGI